jgi:hypothetical protein
MVGDETDGSMGVFAVPAAYEFTFVQDALDVFAEQPAPKLKIGSGLKGPAKCACLRHREN